MSERASGKKERGERDSSHGLRRESSQAETRVNLYKVKSKNALHVIYTRHPRSSDSPYSLCSLEGIAALSLARGQANHHYFEDGEWVRGVPVLREDPSGT